MRAAAIFGGYRPLGGQSRLSLLSFSNSPSLTVSAVFVLFYLLAALYFYSHNYRDPTSVFFDATRGYDKAYSLRREQEAEAFVQENNANISTPRIHQTPPSNPSLCLGIATVARPKKQYIDKTVGSLLHGLSEEDRAKLHFVFFIAHANPRAHPSSGEPWTQNLPDTLLDYPRDDRNFLRHLKEWESDRDHRNKAFYDYSYLLNACKDTGAPYIAMLEGDVLAAPGWLERSISAAETVDVDAGMSTKLEGKPNWVYIRMFWTEAFLGWNSEEWRTYVFWSAAIWIVFVAGLISIRVSIPRTRSVLSNPVIFLITCVFLPLSILLYFGAGRNSMQPPSAGVRRMENFGCCSQGMIISSQQVPTILDAINSRLEGYMDMLLEALATRDGLERWAIYPSLLQHIGIESSKGDATADARARMIWNFAFERYGQILEKGRNLWRH